jgi:Protein of unknown function (DUF4089)
MEASVDVHALGTAVGLDIAAEYRAGVAAQFSALCAQAELVLSSALPDELEPAPIFVP